MILEFYLWVAWGTWTTLATRSLPELLEVPELLGEKRKYGPNRDKQWYTMDQGYWLTKKLRSKQVHAQTMCDFFWYLWQTKHWNLQVSICVYLKDRRATCELWGYLCLPVLTWDKAQLQMWTLGLLVSTSVYLRDMRATCGLWDYLCLPELTWGKAQLHVNTWATCVYLCLLEG